MKKSVTFEEAMSLLEEKIKLLESGTLSLDESISVYEETVGLIKICNEKIENAEQRIRILTEASDGSITDAPYVKYDED